MRSFPGSPWHAVIVWGLLSSQYFFSTGHQATIPAIRFEAAFVGLPGDMNNNILPGMKVSGMKRKNGAYFRV